MKHPELLLIPAFMFADYFLTLAGAALKDRKYGNHFKAEHYELNPIWQQQVAQKIWFNPKHIMLTVVTSSLFICLAEYGDMPEPAVQGFTGCLFSIYGMVIGRHLSNLVIFGHMIRKPDDISGQITMSHSLLLSVSLCQHLVAFVPLGLIAVFSPTPFATGAFAGVLLLVAIHLKWIWKHKRQTRASNKASAAPKPGVAEP